MAQLWSEPSGFSLGTIQERTTTTIVLPISTAYEATLTKISGQLPPGLRIEGFNLVGTPFEVSRTSVFTFVIRASINEDSTGEAYFEDRTFRITIEGPDTPVWLTPEDLLAIGPNDTLFVLDTAPVDYQLEVIDSDIAAGQTIEYYIKPGNGELPPGVTLTSEGRIVGITEPLLALDNSSGSGYFDTNGFSNYPFDFGILPANGFASFYYDSTFYDLSIPTRSPRKLNRFYQFIVSATDGETVIDRKFRIYVVGDDFLRSDNTIMTGADGIFKADNTYVRTPIWLTPGNLGFRRANNYITLFLDVLDTEALLGKIVYTLESFNDDGSVSELPPGLVLDNNTGEIAGRVPYQPAVTIPYKFTIKATRYTADINIVNIVGTYYEDVLVGKNEVKIYKLEQNSGGIFDENADDVDDLRELIGRYISIGEFSYRVTSVDDSNPDYDTITLDQALNSQIPLVVTDGVSVGDDYFFVDSITQAQRDELEGRKLNHSDTETNTITSIVPYIEWKIIHRDGGTIEIDYSAIDADQPTGNPTLSAEIKRIFSSSLGAVYVTKSDNSTIQFSAPYTSSTTRNIIEQVFVAQDSVADSIKTILVREDIDKVQLNEGSLRGFAADVNIGLAVLERESFDKEISVNSNDEVVQPSTDKTFTLNLLGEVDSTIVWNTASNLGNIRANFISTLAITATTTVPNARLVYTKTSGTLPPGLELLFDGEIIGKVRQFSDSENDGLTIFDTGTTTFDNGETSIDRVFKFTVDARDRFGYSAVQREFTITILDEDDLLYSNLVMKPMLKQVQRTNYNSLIADSTIFPPGAIYRPNDPEFGLQKEIKILAYAGLETKNINEYVSKASRFHKRRRYQLGDVKTAVAKLEGTNDIIYEVVYVEVIDPADPAQGKTNKRLTIANDFGKVTVDSIQYETKDDQFKTNTGVPAIQIGDDIVTDYEIVFETRDGQDFKLLPGDTDVVTRNGDEIKVVSETDSAPFAFRPDGDTVKADTTGVKTSDGSDIGKHISNITNMRDELRLVGETERGFLPLWMRTAQEGGVAELGYVMAIPLCYCKEGESNQIKLNLLNSNFDFKNLDLEIDRYIIDATTGVSQDQYIKFPDYQFNV